MTEDSEFLLRRLSQEQEEYLRSLLDANDEEDADIAASLGVRSLTDDQRQVLRKRLAGLMSLRADGSPDDAGSKVDEIIGLLSYY
ncbi:MAG: hypothetical protein ABJA81_02765 [Nocardioidaceae bacterium]